MNIVDNLHKIAVAKVEEIKKANSFIKEETSNTITLNTTETTSKTFELDPMWKIAHEEAVDEYNEVKALIVSYKTV